MRYKLQAKLSTVFLHPSVKLECLGDGLFVLCVVFFFFLSSPLLCQKKTIIFVCIIMIVSTGNKSIFNSV